MNQNNTVPHLPDMARKIAPEGMVLLKNEGNILPLTPGTRVSVFGRIASHYYKSGTGSGGLVNVTYETNILDALMERTDIEVNTHLKSVYDAWEESHPYDEGSGWAQEPWSQEEMPVSDELVKEAAAESDAAIIVIGRTAGEDRDNTATKGGYYLTDTEQAMIETVCRYFERVSVVLNVGNIIDMSWADSVPSILYAWQGGMEGGRATADVLCGEVSPSGKLTDTIAEKLSDYPSDANFGGQKENIYKEDIYVGYRYFETVKKDCVRFPFGYGLSYTEFSLSEMQIETALPSITVRATVTNIGTYSGKEVVQVYLSAPQGALGKPARVLCGFQKTKELAPNESETVTVTVDVTQFASFDDSGASGYKNAFVLEAGEYGIYVGTDVRSAKCIGAFSYEQTTVTEQLSEACAPETEFLRMRPKADGNECYMETEEVPLKTVDLDARIRENLPEAIPLTGDKGIRLQDVADGKDTLDAFVAQFSAEDLACIARGEGMNSPKVTPGTGSAFGGLTKGLAQLGIPAGCTTDGPSGIRMDSGAKATSLPSGTLLASTWEPELVEMLFREEGQELVNYEIDALLGPGMNIHRHPLNGRNFEYFSEDPLLTGRMAAAICRGLAQKGVTATIKHFMCNNQETERHNVNAVVSARALREIYLKGFEIAVKEGNATALMTSYNPVNGIWSAANYDLNTTILRNEWHYRGFVMSDWWAKTEEKSIIGKTEGLARMVRAQNDVYMVTNDAKNNPDDIMESLESGALTVGELQRNAKNICRYLLSAHALKRFDGSQKTDLAEDWEQLTSVWRADGRPSEKTYEPALDESGKYVLSVVVESDASPLAQIPMDVRMGGQSAASFTAHGGERQEYRKEIALMKDQPILLDFSDSMLRVVQVELRR